MKVLTALVFLVALGLAGVSVVLFRLAFEPVDWDKGWRGPVVLERTQRLTDDGIGGLWTGDAFYPHDCPGCETRERLWLDLASDSTGWLIVSTDELNLLPFPIFGRDYGRPEPCLATAVEVEVREGCLVSKTPTGLNGRGWTYEEGLFPERFRAEREAQLDSSLRANRAELGCPVLARDSVTDARALNREGDQLIVEGLGSAFGQ